MHGLESCFVDRVPDGACSVAAEGNVTWTDQQHLLGDEGPGLSLTRQQALIKFGKYLLHFRSDCSDRKGRVISYRCWRLCTATHTHGSR